MSPALTVQGEPLSSCSSPATVRGSSLQDRMLAGSAFVLLVCYLVPLAGVVALSVLAPAPGLGNYWALFQNSTVRVVVGNTLWINSLTVSITLLLAYVTAYGLVQARPAARRWMLACVLLPLWISVLVRNYAWIALLSPGGIANGLLLRWGWVDHPLSLARNAFGVVLGMVHYMLPYAIMPIYAQMVRIEGNAASGAVAGRQSSASLRSRLPAAIPSRIGRRRVYDVDHVARLLFDTGHTGRWQDRHGGGIHLRAGHGNAALGHRHNAEHVAAAGDRRADMAVQSSA
nr:hypothetical protein [Bradyrhizobium glycinis]